MNESEQRWSRLISTIDDGYITAAWANDIFEKAGSPMRAIEGDVITEELADQLWDAAVKIRLVHEQKYCAQCGWSHIVGEHIFNSYYT